MVLPFVMQGVLVPAVVCGFVLLVTWRTRNAKNMGPAWASALAIGLAYLVGHAASLGEIPGFPPKVSTHSFFYAVAAATVLGLFEGLGRGNAISRLFLRLVMGVFLPWMLLQNLVARWEREDALIHLGSMAVLFVAVWTASERWAARRPGATLPLSLWAVATATSISVMLTGSAIYAQFGGTLAGALGAALVMSWWNPRISLAGGGAGIATAIVFGICVAGVYLSELPREAALCLVGAPVVGYLFDRGPGEKWAGRKAVLWRLGWTCVPLAVAVFLAWRAAPEPYE